MDSGAERRAPGDLAHPRRVLGWALMAMAVWVALAVAIALQEPSLGWRFAPDPQGQGLLAYDPAAAVKVARREDALARVVALRLEGQPALALDSLLGVEAPSMLAQQQDMERFFALQRQVWEGLRQAQAEGRPVHVQLDDGRWMARAVTPRPWNELGWLFWVPLLCGVIPFVVGVGAAVYRWRSLGVRFLALASVMALLSLAEVSVVTGRLVLLAPWFAEAGQIFVRCTSLVAVWAFTMMMLHYPAPLPHARRWAWGSAAALVLLLALNVLQWPDSQTLRYKLWLVVASAAFVGLSVWQGLASRADPVTRAAARWLAGSALLSFSVVIYAFAVSLVYDVQVISNSYRWLSVPLLYLGLIASVGRGNLFELERWWVPLCLWYLGGTLVVMIDLALVALLHLHASAALTVSLLLMGWLYFPARQWLLVRLRDWSTPGVVAYVPDLIGAVNAGLAGDEAARLAWRQLLERVFQPQSMHWHADAGVAGREAARVHDIGRELHVADVAGQGCWVLTLAQRGRRLFTQQHVHTAAQLWQLLDVGLSQQRQTRQAVEQERQRIAADLHDDLGAKLLLLAQTGGADGTARLARQALDDMRQSVRGMAGQAQLAAHALADWRAETVQRLNAAGFTADWQAQEPAADLMLAPRLHLQITRVLREAVSNALRHSQGQRCRVQVAWPQGQLELVVEDDGQGLPPASSAATGLGLANIERRARKLGGRHAFTRSAWGGLRVQVQVPLEPSAAAGTIQ